MLIGFVFIMQIRHQNLSSITEESIVLENQFIETEVTREEAISIIASRKNMPDAEVTKLFDSFDSGDSLKYSYHELLSIKDFGEGRQIEAGVLYRKRVEDNKIDQMIETWTQAYSGEAFEFIEAYNVATIDETQNRIHLETRGMVEIKIEDYYERTSLRWKNVSGSGNFVKEY